MNALKTQLQAFNTQQKHQFATQSVEVLLRERSRFYDDLLLALWQAVGLATRQDLALVAVGGYGREEMFPLSDLDILVLCEAPLAETEQAQLNQLANQLWDSGLQLGLAVRTLTECVEVGKAELSVATNMLESRFLAGKRSLWQHLMQRLNQADFWPIEDFFRAKMAEKAERYARYHNTGYNLEPDLKHSPGGLRDLHLLSWIMLRHANLHSLEQLNANGLLYEEEYQELSAAQTTLFRMRFALHLQLKRYDNRLRFDRQLQLSEQLGFSGSGNRPVEQMMKGYFQATQSISQLTQLLLNQFEQQWLSPLPKNREKQPLDADFSVVGNQLVCENPAQFSQTPAQILDLFDYLTIYPEITASPNTLRTLRLALRRLKSPLCENAQARASFIQLFSRPNMVRRAIVPMHQLGVLSAYLPEWRQIEGLMQFDLFHIYTVDEHSVRVMLNLEQFLNPDNQKQFPLCCRLFPTLPNRALIYLAALFHDIAKGREGDHAAEGAKIVQAFAQQHGFDQDATDLMTWLVAEHLTMSITAQRRDIHDPNVIQHFAKKVGNPTALSALTCLTVADIHGTHDTLWNDWKRTLFTQLYQFTLTQLELGDEMLNNQKQADTHRQQALDQIKFVLDAIGQQRLTDFWQTCPTPYFVRNTPTQLVWHALHYLKQPSLPRVLVSNQYARGATEIFIHCHDQPQLFARIAHTLSRKKISIHDAQIITGENGTVLDSFIVTELNGNALSDERLSQIQIALTHTLSQSTSAGLNFTPPPSKHRSFKAQTRLRFLDGGDHATAFELFTLDREGLLAQIADIFNRLHLNLLNAKITTIGERVEDFFVVNTVQHQALSPELQQQLQTDLLAELGKV